jgi:hypothetical protein
VKFFHFSIKKLGFLGISLVQNLTNFPNFFVKISPTFDLRKEEEKTSIRYAPQGERLPIEQ